MNNTAVISNDALKGKVKSEKTECFSRKAQEKWLFDTDRSNVPCRQLGSTFV